MKHLLLSLSIIISACVYVSGQTPTGCEENMAYLDGIIAKWAPSSSSVLIIVEHPGTGEYSREVSRRRLHNAREYLLYRRPTARNSIVVAEGEPKSGLGMVVFYLDGKIVEQLFVKKNKNLCVDCCSNGNIPPYKSPRRTVRKVPNKSKKGVTR